MRYTLSLLLILLATYVQAQELVRKASLGFTPVPIDSTIIDQLELKSSQGLLITNISVDGTFNALKAKNNDILLSLNSTPINSIPDLLSVRNTLRAADNVTATVLRNGTKKSLNGAAKPLPYETSEYSEVIYDQFDFKDGQIRTIINKPNKKGKHPVIFFIPGYTCSSIDNFHPINPYGKLIEGFLKKGYAVFRMEKPGMGDNTNTGDCRQLGFDNELESYFMGYDQLKKYDFIDQNNVFIWGHSMGGLYAPLIAAEKQPKGLAFYGMIHDTWTEYLLRMVRYQNPRIGASDFVETDKDLKHLYAMLYEHYHLKKKSKELAKNPEYAKLLTRDFWFDGENQILFRHEDFWLELYDYSLTEALAKYNGYVLSMNGEADLEVVNDFSQKEVVKIVNHYHPGHGEFAYFPKTDHMMIEVGTLEEGAVIRYQPRYRTMMQDNFNHSIIEKTHSWIQEKIKSDFVKNKVIKDWYNIVDKSKITNSSASCDIVWNEKVAGSMKYHKIISGGQLIIQDTSEMEGIVWEKLDVILSLQDLKTKSGNILLKYPNEVELQGNVTWANDSLAGNYVVIQNGEKKNNPISISNADRILGRAAIFGLLPAFPVEVGQEYEIDLFAFSDTDIFTATIDVLSKETITWREKEVEVFKISLTGGKVENIIYMATDGSGKLYRIDVVGQNMQIILE